jgi:hypothetical protein
MIEGKIMGHPKESKKTGIGLKKKEHPVDCICSSCCKSPVKWGFRWNGKRKPIRKVSSKQRARTRKLHENFERVLKVQWDLYGANFCQAGAGEWRDKCPDNKNGKRYPLVPDHVLTRNGKNVDRHGNLQPLCSWCNFQKGSVRLDFRPAEFVKACEKLDESCRECGSEKGECAKDFEEGEL